MFKPTLIIIHHSATKDSGTVSWEAIRRFHTETNKWKEIGYHWGIERVGDHFEIMTGRPSTEPGAHAKGVNNISLGICCVGDYDKEDVPEEMFQMLVGFVFGLLKRFKLGPENVKRHADFSPKTCPGTRFPWTRLIKELQEKMKGAA